jgi:hypothetical protein
MAFSGTTSSSDLRALTERCASRSPAPHGVDGRAGENVWEVGADKKKRDADQHSRGPERPPPSQPARSLFSHGEVCDGPPQPPRPPRSGGAAPPAHMPGMLACLAVGGRAGGRASAPSLSPEPVVARAARGRRRATLSPQPNTHTHTPLTQSGAPGPPPPTAGPTAGGTGCAMATSSLTTRGRCGWRCRPRNGAFWRGGIERARARRPHLSTPAFVFFFFFFFYSLSHHPLPTPKTPAHTKKTQGTSSSRTARRATSSSPSST